MERWQLKYFQGTDVTTYHHAAEDQGLVAFCPGLHVDLLQIELDLI